MRRKSTTQEVLAVNDSHGGAGDSYPLSANTTGGKADPRMRAAHHHRERLMGLVAHAESAPQTVRAREERRKRILERGGKLPQVRRV